MERAVKIYSKADMKDELYRKKFRNEVEILRTLDHPNIVKLFEVYEDTLNYYLVEEKVLINLINLE